MRFARISHQCSRCAVLILTALFYLPSARASEINLASCAEAARQVDQLFAALPINNNTPGGAVAVMQQARILYKAAYGLADVKKNQPLTPQSLFHLASAGKQFTALAVMKLVEAGKLAYDDPIGKHLPELARFGKQVTIRRLLQHTSGVPDYYDDPLWSQLTALNPQPNNRDALNLLATEGRLQFKPGSQFSYSNTGYDMLGSLVERVSGQAFPAFMQQHIFERVGMANTFSLPNPQRLKDPAVSASYFRENRRVVAYEPDALDGMVGSGSVYTTVEDLALYDAALYTDALVSPATLAAAYRPAVLNDGERTDYGFGWYVGSEDGRRYAYHEGSWLGFISYYTRFLDQQLGVIVMLNRDYDSYNMTWEIAKLYLDSGCATAK